MKKKVNILSMMYLAFLMLVFISGAVGGFFGEAVYFLAFLLPFLIGYMLLGKDEKPWDVYLGFDRRCAVGTALVTAPTVTIIMSVSIVTSWIIFNLTGKTDSVDIGSSILLALVYHALIPSVLEEALFRYLPMRMLSSHSKRATVILSAVFFALVHHSLFSIPYAFVAGIVLIVVDMAFESIWPSVIIHFLNNAVSVFLMFGFGAVVYPLLLTLCAISAVIIFLKRKEYKKLFVPVFSGGEKFKLTVDFAVFAVITLLIAVVALF